MIPINITSDQSFSCILFFLVFYGVYNGHGKTHQDEMAYCLKKMGFLYCLSSRDTPLELAQLLALFNQNELNLFDSTNTSRSKRNPIQHPLTSPLITELLTKPSIPPFK
jgi:hypothetical protein